MVKLDYNQSRKVHKLIREECCNCVDGSCILLDDACVQLISQQYIYFCVIMTTPKKVTTMASQTCQDGTTRRKTMMRATSTG